MKKHEAPTKIVYKNDLGTVDEADISKAFIENAPGVAQQHETTSEALTDTMNEAYSPAKYMDVQEIIAFKKTLRGHIENIIPYILYDFNFDEQQYDAIMELVFPLFNDWCKEHFKNVEVKDVEFIESFQKDFAGVFSDVVRNNFIGFLDQYPNASQQNDIKTSATYYKNLFQKIFKNTYTRIENTHKDILAIRTKTEEFYAQKELEKKKKEQEKEDAKNMDLSFTNLYLN